MNKFLLFLLHITLLSSLAFAFLPTPRPAPNACGKDYKPVCGESSSGSTVTFANICKLELENQYSGDFTLKYEGTCEQEPTPTPNPFPHELTCKEKYISTTAYDVNLTVEHTGSIYNLAQSPAHTNHPNIAINPDSTRFIDEEGERSTSKEIENIGIWELGTGGMITFKPFVEYNASGVFTNLEANTTISVDYIINNNCDENKNFSNKATLNVTIIDPNKNLPGSNDPWFYNSPHSCFNQTPIDAINDTVTLKKNEKMKIISVLENDNNYRSNSHPVFASLRLIDKNDYLQRKISIKNIGTWLADRTSGQVLFIPESNFKGETTIRYTIHSSCTSHHLYSADSFHSKSYSDYSKAKITVIVPTPTPTPTPKPCPRTKKPVCGQENLCKVSPSGETICLASIPQNTTYTNMCELFNAGDVFLYDGECHTPTPTPKPTPTITPTPTPTPKATPKPKPVTITTTEEPKPTANTTVTTETNTTQNTSTLQSSDGSALGSLSLFGVIMLTGIIGFFGMRRKETLV
jgi:hypothetical protein